MTRQLTVVQPLSPGDHGRAFRGSPEDWLPDGRRAGPGRWRIALQAGGIERAVLYEVGDPWTTHEACSAASPGRRSPRTPTSCRSSAIGEELHPAEKTVEHNMSSILRKLDMDRRTEAAVFWTQVQQDDCGCRAHRGPARQPQASGST